MAYLQLQILFRNVDFWRENSIYRILFHHEIFWNLEYFVHFWRENSNYEFSRYSIYSKNETFRHIFGAKIQIM